MNLRSASAFFLLISSAALLVESFVVVTQRSSPSSSRLSMAPKFDKAEGKWVPSDPATEGPEAGYGIGKTLLLQGPKPFLHRVFQPDDYEQAVLKFMATDKVGRREAQGNMDAYLENAQDWAFSRYEEQKTGYKRDYTSINQKQVALTLTWASVVLTALGRAGYSLSTGEYYWSFLYIH